MSKAPHRRRTEDELRAALARVEALRTQLHVNRDDEHVEVLQDACRELLQLRRLTSTLLQDAGAAVETARKELKGLTLL